MRIDSQWIAIGATFGRDNVRLPIAGLDVDTRYRFSVVAIGIDEARSSRSATAEMRTDSHTLWSRVTDFGNGIWDTITGTIDGIGNLFTSPGESINAMLVQWNNPWDFLVTQFIQTMPLYQAGRMIYYIANDDFAAAGRLYGNNVFMAAAIICSLLFILSPLGKLVIGTVKKTTNALVNQASKIYNKVKQYLANKNLKRKISNPPASRSLTNFQARDWYVENVRNIGNMIDRTLPLEQQARQASQLRNIIKDMAREGMRDTALANSLNTGKPPPTWEQIMSRYNGDWQAIIDASMRPNANVNRMFGIN